MASRVLPSEQRSFQPIESMDVIVFAIFFAIVIATAIVTSTYIFASCTMVITLFHLVS